LDQEAKMRTRPSWIVLGIAALALIGAAALTLSDMRLASSQTVTLVAKRTQEAVPLDDPSADVWDRANPVELPLSGQNLTLPMGGEDRTITSRALHDGERLYVLMEWEDETEDLTAGRLTEFSDAAAVQFPVAEGEAVPAFCMGDPNTPVNIWQWKAAWQTDVEEGFVDVDDIYPDMFVDHYPFGEEAIFYPARSAGNVFAQTDRTTAVDNLLAGSFGTLTQATDQIVAGAGGWQDGIWRVVFARDLTADADYSQFGEGASTNVAFAVWDGAAGERDGIKSVSQFLTLELSSVETGGGGGGDSAWAVFAAVLGGLALAAGLALYGGLRRRRV
jgi:hypothetical protein